MSNPGYSSGVDVFADETGVSMLKRFNGALYFSNDGGATWSAIGTGGGGAAPWFTNLANFARTVDPLLVAVPFVTECNSLTQECAVNSVAGSGSVLVGLLKSAGYFIIKTGASANSFQLVNSKDAFGSTYIANVRTSHWAVATLFQIIQTQVTGDFRLTGLADNANILCFGFNPAIHATNYSTTIGGTTAASTIPIDLVAQHSGLMVNDGTNIKSYVGASDGTGLVLATTIPSINAPTTSAIWSATVNNLATAANCEFHLDAAMVLTGRG